MSFDDLALAVKLLLKPQGRFALVLPLRESAEFLKSAAKNGLFLCKQQNIIPVEGKEPNRINMEFRFMPFDTLVKDALVIRSVDNCFTKQYKDFLKDFYLGL
jgi:Predicted O-methyltransferase